MRVKCQGTKLFDLAGIWSSTKWILPSQDSTGHIKNAGTAMVLGVMNSSGTEVIEEELNNSPEQIWKIVSQCCEKCYIIKHVSSGKVLTAVSTSDDTVKLVVKGMYKIIHIVTCPWFVWFLLVRSFTGVHFQKVIFT